MAKKVKEPKAIRRYRLGKSSEASGTRGIERRFYAVERSRLPPQAGAGKRDSFKFLVALILTIFSMPLVFAQEEEPVVDEDGSSEQVEQRDDSFRRQMELEDARSKDRTYVDNTYGKAAELEKIDKLPEESRDNIRDQLVDVIMENGDWEPRDALEEYPYTPTEAAQADSELMGQEQEAWDEQIEKYHEREAAAFGSHRGPVPGPGNPTGQEGGQQGDGSEQGQQGGEQGSGQEGQEGAGESGSGSEGTYEPYQSSSNGAENEISTAGVSESALDFLRGSQGRQQPPQGEQTQSQAEASQESSQQAQAEQDGEQVQSEQQQESTQDDPRDTRGIIAIEDLDKLEGTEIPDDPDDPDDSQDP